MSNKFYDTDNPSLSDCRHFVTLRFPVGMRAPVAHTVDRSFLATVKNLQLIHCHCLNNRQCTVLQTYFSSTPAVSVKTYLNIIFTHRVACVKQIIITG